MTISKCHMLIFLPGMQNVSKTLLNKLQKDYWFGIRVLCPSTETFVGVSLP